VVAPTPRPTQPVRRLRTEPATPTGGTATEYPQAARVGEAQAQCEEAQMTRRATVPPLPEPRPVPVPPDPVPVPPVPIPGPDPAPVPQPVPEPEPLPQPV